ncbi:hypothetical protein PTSG_01377 [Salpingoeca rosetta]|uniref:CTCHY-type domain-containing protein n=1 Tax=Salpingoeca rosetta (strain ATCC 50818 / BSB-021) TaxID=946362 RepID=F2U061_SALR5|nr:uncharacterized protein PTSG_01377 [Salpingoeca rosetta]EGD80789.1 hypothetical protein PTSG_01377 [Salpingoeca rosetta]|eukprot:XP_004997350.1 hypothetical protein PTSG_01377 [Salpingoeca rosetta]
MDVWGELGKRVPTCPHGPLLLFETHTQESMHAFTKDKEENEENEGEARGRGRASNKQPSPHTHVDIATRQRYSFCRTCSRLLLASQRKKHPRSHDVVAHVPTHQLQQPTLLLQPASKRRQNAQYLFSPHDTAFVLQKLRQLGAQRVVCMGCPSIHEAIQQQNRHPEDKEQQATHHHHHHHHHQQQQQQQQQQHSLGKGEHSVVCDSDGTCLDSMLLDLDDRFAQFFPTSYAKFNMLNTFFFDRTEQMRALDFIASADALVVDPPFGCPLAALAHAIHWIQDRSPRGRAMPVLLFFPYFSAAGLAHVVPELKRSNYCVTYTNHKTYTQPAPALARAPAGNIVADAATPPAPGKKGMQRKHKYRHKKGKQRSKGSDSASQDVETNNNNNSSNAGPARLKASPVRIFTNIPLSSFSLPSNHYRFCEECQLWTFKHAPHCSACGVCPSLNGEPYHHCTECKTCVKPRRVHCGRCRRCVPASSHKCGVQLREASGQCFLCGGRGHAMMQCKRRPEHLRHLAAVCKAALPEQTLAAVSALQTSRTQHASSAATSISSSSSTPTLSTTPTSASPQPRKRAKQ